MKKFNIDGDGYLTKKEQLKLNEIQILSVVNHWYTRIEPNIFQDENGLDLEELVENQLCYLYEQNKNSYSINFLDLNLKQTDIECKNFNHLRDKVFDLLVKNEDKGVLLMSFDRDNLATNNEPIVISEHAQHLITSLDNWSKRDKEYYRGVTIQVYKDYIDAGQIADAIKKCK
jgi:hypothetical protein